MRKKFLYRGSVAGVVIVLVLLLALAGAGYWFYTRGGGMAGGSAFDMAGHLPNSSRMAWMLNMQGQIDPDDVRADFKELLSKMPPDAKTRFEEDFKAELGVTPAEAAEFFDGRAAGAVLQQGDKPGAVALLGLRDAAGFDKLVKSKFPEGGKSEAVGGVNFTFTPNGEGYGQDGTWAYLADSKASAELLVASATGKDTLAGVPTFTEAKGRVAEGGSLMAFYWDIASTVKAIEKQPVPYTDAQTFKDLACLQYAVGSLDLRSEQANAFLKVLDDKSSLSQKLLAKGSVTPASFGALTQATSGGHALDLEWTFNTLVQLAMLSPDSRQGAGMAGMGLAMYGNPFAAFEGEIAITSDWVESMVPILTTNFGAARAQGQFTACKSNLKNIGTACEMWCTDNQGRYPKTLNELTPNYLKQVPQCPAAGTDTYSSTYKATTSPDSYEFACSGNHHQQSADNLPSYNSMEGLNAGTPIEGGDPAPEQIPSVAVTALVKDAALAHNLLAKGLGEAAGAAPKAPEEKVYPVPGGTLVMKTAPPARLVFGFGAKSDALLDTKGGSLADQPVLKKALEWGGDGVIYADYMNLNPLIEGIEKAISASAESTPESEMAKSMVAKARELELEGASCFAVRPDGLAFRSYGSSGGGLAFIGGAGAAVLVPNFIRARAQGQLTACKSNLKNIGTGLEMYSTDYSGKYPDSMDKLTPNYLRTIPECPAAATVTYRAHFGPKAKGNTEGYEDYYYVECAGANHEAVSVPADFPAYNGIQGLLDGPL
jgi:hypothetical protein